MNTKQLLLMGLLATGIIPLCTASDSEEETSQSLYIKDLTDGLEIQASFLEKRDLFRSKISEHYKKFIAELNHAALGDKTIFQLIFSPEFNIENDIKKTREASKLWLSYVMLQIMQASQGIKELLPRRDIALCIQKYRLADWLDVHFECFLPGITNTLTNESMPIPLYSIAETEEESTSASSESGSEYYSNSEEFSVNEDDNCGLIIDGLSI